MATSTAAKSKAASAARKAEANPESAEPITFEFNNRTYTIEHGVLDNLELFEAIEDEKYLTATRGFLGREQWEAFKNDHRDENGRVPMAPLESFLGELMGAVGRGNSSASSGS